MKKVTVSLVSYNHERYLSHVCRSLAAQSYADWELIVVDNNSFDRSAAIIAEELPSATVIRKKFNSGFSRAHNLTISLSKSPYILVLNPDVIMDPNCLGELVEALDNEPQAGSMGAKLLYWDFEKHERSQRIDSFGLQLKKNYGVADWLQGEDDRSIPATEIFGPSGALMLLRREALDEIKVQRSSSDKGYEYFDEDFFAYKEDADLSWRLRQTGWKSYLVPEARAFHHRQVSAIYSSRAERKKRSIINRYSYRNHLLMIYKNHYWALTLKYILFILSYELAKFVYLLLVDRSSLTGLADAVRLLPVFRRKRHAVKEHRRLKAKEFSSWLT